VGATPFSFELQPFYPDVAFTLSEQPGLMPEAAFVDLGSIAGALTDSSGLTLADVQLQFSVKGETLAAVGILPLGRWDLFLKGGVFFADTRLSTRVGANQSVSRRTPERASVSSVRL
jgi:hypothetical protein